MLSVMISSLEVRKKGAMLLTEALFFDTDCLSAFLWVGNESLLPQLYPGKIVIPKPVYRSMASRSGEIPTTQPVLDS